MARRFKRQNFLFPLDLRQNAIQPAASPTNTFASASQGALLGRPEEPFPVPRPSDTNGFLQLAEALETVNPAIRDYLTNRTKQYQEASIAEGNRIFNERGKGRLSWKELIQDVRRNAGDAAADELLKLNPYVQIAYDENFVRSEALKYGAELQKAYNDNIEIEFEGRDPVRFKDIEVGSGLLQEYLSRLRQGTYSRLQNSEADMMMVQKIFEPYITEVEKELTDGLLERNLSQKITKLEDSAVQFSSYAVNVLATDERFLRGTPDERKEALVEAGKYVTDSLQAYVDVAGTNDPGYPALVRRLATNISELAVGLKDEDVLELLREIKTGYVGESVIEYEEQVQPDGTVVQTPVENDNYENRVSILQTYDFVRSLYTQTKIEILNRDYVDEQRQYAREDRQQAKNLEFAQNLLSTSYRAFQEGRMTREQLDGYVNEVLTDPNNFNNLSQLTGFVFQMDEATTNIRSQKTAAEFMANLVSGNYTPEELIPEINAAYGRGDLQFDEFEGLLGYAKRDQDRVYGEFYSVINSQATEFVSGIAEQAGYFMKPSGEAISYAQLIQSTTGTTATILADLSPEQQLGVFRQAQSRIQQTLGFEVDLNQFKMFLSKAEQAEQNPQPLDPFVLSQMKNDFIIQGFAGLARSRASGIQANPATYTQIASETLTNFQARSSSLFSNNNSFINRQSTGVRNQPITVQNWWHTNALKFERVFRGRNYNWDKDVVLNVNSINGLLQMVQKTGELPPTLEAAASSLGISPIELLLKQAELQGYNTERIRGVMEQNGYGYLFVPRLPANIQRDPRLPSNVPTYVPYTQPPLNVPRIPSVTSPNKLPAPPPVR